jgi:hypothetical protein
MMPSKEVLNASAIQTFTNVMESHHYLPCWIETLQYVVTFTKQNLNEFSVEKLCNYLHMIGLPGPTKVEVWLAQPLVKKGLAKGALVAIGTCHCDIRTYFPPCSAISPPSPS